MYRKIFIIMTLVLLVVPTSFAASNIGDDIGDVLSTDIITKINGVAINSFNINGNTAVYVTELRKLGYDVNWNGEERKVTVTENYEKQPITLSTPNIEPYEKENSNQKIGTPIDDVLYTDIVTYMKGAEVESFNINGSTAIYVNDFTRLGVELEWDGENREVKLTKEQKTDEEIDELKIKSMSNYERILSNSELPNGVISISTKKVPAPSWEEYDVEYEMTRTYNIEEYPSATNAQLLFHEEEKINNLEWWNIIERTQYNSLDWNVTSLRIVDNYMFILLDKNGNILGYKVLDADGNTVKVD